MSFRGVVKVEDGQDRVFDFSLNLNGFEAQKCVFPFEYHGVTYNDCTNVDLGYLWCSPTATYSGQIIRCDSIGKLMLLKKV